MKKKKTSRSGDTTPLMEQYLSIKAKYQDMILLYRMGDFYETFYEDARIISRVLGIALTRRSHGKVADVPLAGFPYHALDAYLPKLIHAGYKVAICEQVEDPKLAKTVVKREVVEVITPGTALSEKLLDHKTSNYLAAIYPGKEKIGIGYADISTGEFYITEVIADNLVSYLQEIDPREILVPASWQEHLEKLLSGRVSAITTRLEDWVFNRTFAHDILTDHFQTASLKGFGAEDFPLGVVAAGAILHYAKENYQNQLSHIHKLAVISADEYMILDETTRRNLEITIPLSPGGKEATLLSILDQTLTPMGGRLLKHWLTHPLIRLERIHQRLNRVDVFYRNDELRTEVRAALQHIGDLERLLARISTGRANPRDLIALKNALKYIQPIKNLLQRSGQPELQEYADGLTSVEEVIQLIETAIVENPPVTITEGNIIRDGYHPELDELRKISREGKNWIVELQEKERQRTGIPSLKIGYNKVFGYYFEVTRAHLDKVPDYFHRKQTLVNAERFVTPDLKAYEEKVLGAEEKIAALEHQLFQQIREQIAAHGEAIQTNARLIAELDCLTNFAEVARQNRYVKPEVNDSLEIFIRAGRHPVVEKRLPPDQPFIENDTHISNHDVQIMIITGPNMAGKSTYLRQVGLIVLMAQIGSFVPAEEARIGWVDRIFTRVGASDNVAFGESTFMVEMLETANILHNATPRSLILLDEIGRGTSTFDGLSIAWAVTEYLHNNKRIAAKTLFATHYHELTELAMLYPRIKNFKVTVKEYGDHVVFLRKIEPGGMDNSYGIYVAQMAGLPREVVERAREVLYNLEANELTPSKNPRLARRRSGTQVDRNQLTIFDMMPASPVEEALKKVDINQMTPLEALLKLNELKEMVTAGKPKKES
ncbi:MAG: DNA mismatch repair protein MutS [Calditrichaeota bacterium]|nr:DNA mismatch repair protein MutS [Calditrichota bacterium]